MQAYQIDTSISDRGVIKLPKLPYLYNKKVKLFIISSEENTTELEQRKQALERLLKRQNKMNGFHGTDDEFDNFRYKCLMEKHQ